MKNGETLFLDAIKRNAFGNIFAAIFLGIVFVPLPLIVTFQELSKGKTIMQDALFICPAFAILLGGVCIYLFIKSVRERIEPKNSELYNLVTTKPDDVVWVYKKIRTTNYKAAYVVTVASAQTYSIIIRNKNKKNLEVQVKGELETDSILRYLQEKLPNATFGYSRELEQKFK